jgi:hypothetical protein
VSKEVAEASPEAETEAEVVQADDCSRGFEMSSVREAGEAPTSEEKEEEPEAEVVPTENCSRGFEMVSVRVSGAAHNVLWMISRA